MLRELAQQVVGQCGAAAAVVDGFDQPPGAVPAVAGAPDRRCCCTAAMLANRTALRMEAEFLKNGNRHRDRRIRKSRLKMLLAPISKALIHRSKHQLKKSSKLFQINCPVPSCDPKCTDPSFFKIAGSPAWFSDITIAVGAQRHHRHHDGTQCPTPATGQCGQLTQLELTGGCQIGRAHV